MADTQDVAVFKGPHTYAPKADGGFGYVATGPYQHQEYPRVLYRKRNADEVQIERENLTKEMWMGKETDLIQLTGNNQPKKVQAYEAYVTRPVERIVFNEKEEKALGAGWVKHLSELK